VLGFSDKNSFAPHYVNVPLDNMFCTPNIEEVPKIKKINPWTLTTPLYGYFVIHADKCKRACCKIK